MKVSILIMKKLKTLVEGLHTKTGRTFDIFIQILILFSLLSFSIETLPHLNESVQFGLHLFEILSVIIFTIEYLLRILATDKKLKFIFSFYGIIDLLAILPFYLLHFADLRSIRIFRFFRLFRALKILRYTKALRRFKLAFLSVKEELIVFLIGTAFVLYVSAVGIYYFEHEIQPKQFTSVFHCLWWAVATLTTVGYGDVYPVTIGGKIFTFIMLMIGLGIIAVPAGLVSSALTKVFAEEKKR